MENPYRPTSQFTIDDFEDNAAYGKNKKNHYFAASKVRLLRGRQFHEERPDLMRLHFDRNPAGCSQKKFERPTPPKIETTNSAEVFAVDELTELSEKQKKVLRSGLTFLETLSRRGVHGNKIGTILVIGNIDEIRQHSTDEIPNPLEGHPVEMRSIFDPMFIHSLTEFSQFDGGIGMDWNGNVDFCGRLFLVPENLGRVPLEIYGHGARHKAGWAVTRTVPGCISLVLSQDGEILVLMNGKVLKKIVTNDFKRQFRHKKIPKLTEFDTFTN